MKKIINILFCMFLLVNCKNNNVSNNFNLKESSTISTEELIKTKKEYLTGAVSSLLIIHNYLEIDININKSNYSFDFYYNFNDNIYQLKISDSYLTYKNNILYLDNYLNHFCLDIGYYNGLDLISSINDLENIDVNALDMEIKDSIVILSYNFTIDTFIKIYVQDGIIPTLTKLTISYNTYNLTIKPSNNKKGYTNIEDNKHLNLYESFKFLTDYINFINKPKLDISFELLNESISLMGNVVKDIGEVKGNIEYKNLENTYNIIYNNGLIINNEKVNNYNLLKLIIKNIDKIITLDRLKYLYDLLSSEIIIEDNLIQFIKEDFKEEIKFFFDEVLIITLEYINLKIEIRDVLE